MSFGENLKASRKKQGLTQADLAKIIGMARPNISRIESGRFNPSMLTIQRLARALGTHPSTLLEET